MSESEEHRTLVRGVRNALLLRYPNASVVVDIQTAPGDEVPPQIGGFRPDVFMTRGSTTVIGEAKTTEDIDRPHTYSQVRSFIRYLERANDGYFVLAVDGCRGDLAKTVLRFVGREIMPARTGLMVFDGCDLWSMRKDGITWEILGA